MSSYILPDGTPVEDMLENLKECRAEIQDLKRALRAIGNLCDAPHWTAERRWKIREIAENPTKAHKDA